VTIDAGSAPLSNVAQERLHSAIPKKRRLNAILSALWAVIVAMGGAKSVQKDVLNVQAPEIVPSVYITMN
jgi:hypothetical protein